MTIDWLAKKPDLLVNGRPVGQHLIIGRCIISSVTIHGEGSSSYYAIGELFQSSSINSRSLLEAKKPKREKGFSRRDGELSSFE